MNSFTATAVSMSAYIHVNDFHCEAQECLGSGRYSRKQGKQKKKKNTGTDMQFRNRVQSVALRILEAEKKNLKWRFLKHLFKCNPSVVTGGWEEGAVHVERC